MSMEKSMFLSVYLILLRTRGQSQCEAMFYNSRDKNKTSERKGENDESQCGDTVKNLPQ